MHIGDNIAIKLQAPSSDKGISVATLLINHYNFSFVIIIDTVSPKFISSKTFTLTAKNKKVVGTIKAVDEDIIKYSIKADNTNSKLFDINSSSGAITFKTNPFYEVDFKYNIIVKATDTRKNFDTQNVVIKYNRYVRNAIGIVTDNYTRKMWQDNIIIKKTKNLGMDYCYSLVLGGYGDWTLPTETILQHIVDKTRKTPAISPVFQNVKSAQYWNSSSPKAIIDFSTGHTLYKDDYNTHYIRCYRNEK